MNEILVISSLATCAVGAVALAAVRLSAASSANVNTTGVPGDANRDGQLDPARVTAADFQRRGGGAEAAHSILKRIFDITAAVLVIVALAPLMALTAVVVRLESAGPAIYRQRRVGLHGEVFEIYKFRSMVADAEKNGAQWCGERDPRITRIGRLIRTTRIDELPQAFNVLRGEMSFVGPRPERPEFVGILSKELPNYDLRHSVKPGITGWAQVKFVYAASVEDAYEKLKFDLYYIKHRGVLFDLLIVLMTLRVALFGVGSR